MISDEIIKEALAAFNKVINEPILDKCQRCDGRGYHHGFGENGHDPGWCTECGGSRYNVRPGEEERAMRAAIEAVAEQVAFSTFPSKDRYGVKGLSWTAHENAFPSPAWSACFPFGSYLIEEVSASDSPAYEVRLHSQKLVSVSESLDQAKAAAQADYERRILSALDLPASPVVPEGWRPIDTAPLGKKIIGGYFNELGKWRSVMARYYPEFTLPDETGEEEAGYAPAGWYEEYEASDTIYPVAQPLLKWRPLPPAPEAKEGE